MATGTYAVNPAFTIFDSNGDPVSGGLLYSFTAGTSTPIATYTDVSLLTPNANPAVADAAGRLTVFLSPGTSYKLVAKTPALVTLWTRDNLAATPTTSSTLDTAGTFGEAVTAGAPVYLSDGSGSKTAGQWYLATNTVPYASASPIIGIAPNAASAAVLGTIRLGGQVTGLSALSVGVTYYVGSTAGTLTSTAPAANVRVVGVADSASSLIVSVGPSASSTLDISGTAGETLTAGLTVYLSDGSGGKTAGLWYKADNANTYSATSPNIGVVPAAIASAAVGTIRQGGTVSGLTSLTTGAVYYIGTSGAITATKPTNARVVGQAVSTTALNLQIAPSVPVFPLACQGRLTLTSGSAVTSTDVTGATSIYFTPYLGNRIATYSGTVWTMNTFSEITLALGTLTSGLNYDVFISDSTLALSLVAWSSDTARVTALVLQDGVYVLTGTTTKRYLGTIRTTSTTATADSAAKRFVWNYYNRVPRSLTVADATANWNYTTATWRQANGAAADQLDLVVGVAEQALTVTVNAAALTSAAPEWINLGIGQDSTSAPDFMSAVQLTATTNVSGISVTGTYVPAAGRHFFAWLEAAQAAGTTTWYGTNTTVGGNAQTSRITGTGWLA